MKPLCSGMTSSERLARLEGIFVECLETVVNNDSMISDDKYEVIMDIHNKADMYVGSGIYIFLVFSTLKHLTCSCIASSYVFFYS